MSEGARHGRVCFRLVLGCVLLLATAGGVAAGPSGMAVTILVASSAQDAVAAVAKQFTAEAGIEVKVVPGGSNALAAQILTGAPAALFLSASQEWAEKVRAGGYAAKTQPLLTNDLVLVVPKGNPANVQVPADLTSTAVRKIALAGENVPAGKYAQQALMAAKLYDPLVHSGRIARGRDVRVALQYVARSEAEAGVVYSTDAALYNEVTAVYTFSPETFEKIVYPLVLLKDAAADAAATRFFDYLQSEPARTVFARFGFRRQ